MSYDNKLVPVYYIYDNVSHTYTPPFFDMQIESAKRQFGAFLEGINFSPADFDLYQIGVFDHEAKSLSGSFAAHIVNGSAIKPITKES